MTTAANNKLPYEYMTFQYQHEISRISEATVLQDLRIINTLLTSVNLANQVISDVCGRLEATTNSEATLASNAVIASDILSCRGKSSEG